jgi:2-polyprenyl-3-methyl-5-hydroxy-6-metoxy-1,4-benzoquinol methylase
VASRIASQDRVQTLTAYDQIAYVNRPYSNTHPSHMAVLARLHGLDPAPVERARVLDIGAGEGGNIIPLAATLPGAEFTGIDLAASPIDRGQATIKDLGLKNIRLLRKDVLEVDASFGTFDYIVAHGIYAWTPPEVGDKILAVARANLSPQGVAFVSYNTLPGGHLRTLMRETMLFQAERYEAPVDRVKAARAMLDVVAGGWPDPDPIEQAAAFLAGSIRGRSDSSLYHDFMAPVFKPVYFRDFAVHAARHGLGYVADASVIDSFNMKLSPEALEAVRNAAAGGRIFQEQLLDLLRVRRFRSSLVCHGELKPAARWDPERAVGLHAASAAEETGASGPARELLRDLIGLWPRTRTIGREEVGLALELYRRGMIELGVLPGVAAPPGEWPVASPLVRYQAARGDATIFTLRHRALDLEDAEGRRLLTLLDGSRDRDTLAREMGCSRKQMDAQLTALGRHSILLG